MYEYWFVSDNYYFVNERIDNRLAMMSMYSDDRVMSFETIELLNGLFAFSIDDVSSMRPPLENIIFHFRLLSALKACGTGINQLRDFQTAQRVQETITRRADVLVSVKAG